MGEPPGDACLYPINKPLAIITADCIKWSLSSLINTPELFVHSINSEVVKKQIIEITKGVAQQKISLGRFKGIAIPLPPVIEQVRIVMELEKRYQAASDLEAEIENQVLRSNNLRKAILHKAFSGKLVPQDQNDTPVQVTKN